MYYVCAHTHTHTHSLEHPTEQQVRKWACSFQDLLTDVTGRYKFESFCKSQYCRENIRFWQACRDLKSIPLVSVEGAVKLIYEYVIGRRKDGRREGWEEERWVEEGLVEGRMGGREDGRREDGRRKDGRKKDGREDGRERGWEGRWEGVRM